MIDPADPGSLRWRTGRRSTRAIRLGAPRGPANLRHRLHLRARLDVQGLHRRRRARGGAGHAENHLRPAADDPGRRQGDPGIASARLGDLSVAEILAQSSNVGAVTIGLELGAERFDYWVRRFGFGEPTGIAFPGEEQGIVLEPRGLLRLDHGQPPDRSGPLGDADADGRRLRGDRERRDPATAATDHREGDDAVPAPEGERVISEKSATQVRKMLEGVLAPGGTASEVSVPGYVLAGKTGTAREGRGRRLLGDRLRRLVRRLRARRRPAAAGRGRRRRAPRQLLRRRRRRARVRRDRQVCAALSRHRRPSSA